MGPDLRLHERGQPAEPISFPPPVDLGPDAPGRFLAVSTTANAAAQVLLAANPLVVLPHGASPEQVSVLFVAVTAARVPLSSRRAACSAGFFPAFTPMADSGEVRSLIVAGPRLAVATANLSRRAPPRSRRGGRR